MTRSSAAAAGAGALNLVKLSVGVESVEDLAVWQARRLAEQAAAGRAPRLWHRTRMAPKRVDELLEGGSIYWVIKGRILARQSLVAIEPVESPKAVDLVLGHALVLTTPQPRRPFQGWRYLPGGEAPEDLKTRPGIDEADLPAALRSAVAEYGVV